MFNFLGREWVTTKILVGYFFLASNIAVEKWLLNSYSIFEINFTTAVMFMVLTAFQELFKSGSIYAIKPMSWKILLLISLFTLGAWHFFLSALMGLTVFEFSGMSLLSPLVMVLLAITFLREKPSLIIWPAIFLGALGGWLMMDGKWNGWSGVQYHLFMLGALLFSSLRWVVVKRAGDKVPTSALIFWEPTLVLVLMGSIVDFGILWNKMTPMLLSSAVLLFLSRQCLVRSYQNRVTSAISISSLIYTKLIWSLLFGYLFWNNLPEKLEILGVFLIILSSLLILFPLRRS